MTTSLKTKENKLTKKISIWDLKREDEIICPHCNHQQDEDDKYHCVTYWGDDGDHKKLQCESCAEYFSVIEWVERKWSFYKEGEEVKW